MNTTNRNMLWASIFVDELIRAGVTAVCVAPGSRSTPLAFALAERPEITKYSLLDERGAAFFCLGPGLATGTPAAVLCTSGTAAANFLPAVIEASQSEIPMLVLTADRPAELRHSGANQTIDQVKLYGEYARWFVELPLPEADPLPHLLASLRTTADRAVAVACGLDGSPGPVHLNFPYRKPLEPTPLPTDLSPRWQAARAGDHAFHGRPDGAPFVTINRSLSQPTSAQIETLAGQIQSSPRGLIVCGPRCPAGDFPQAILELARRSGYLVLADPLSGVRFGPHLPGRLVLGGYETFLSSDACRKKLPVPELVLRFGDLPVSAALGAYLGGLPSSVKQIAIGLSARWPDDMFALTHALRADPLETCRRLASTPSREPAAGFTAGWLEAETAAWQVTTARRKQDDFEGAILAEVVEHLPDGTQLYVSNSLPIRHLDQFVAPASRALRVFANRGASGIDGTISTALGVTAGSTRPLVLVSGDLSFYHDLNGLIAFQRCGVAATIVLIHNDGGGIFNRLPAAGFEPGFIDLIRTPHGLDFAPAARMFGVDYLLLDRLAGLGPTLERCVADGRPHILAIKTDGQHGEQARQEIIRGLDDIL